MTDATAAAKPTPDESAAHAFLSELRTRIAIQPLPYGAGVEAAALQSLFELFGHARDAMKEYPGCVRFADLVTVMLNEHVRPVTAKWHRALEAGRLQSRDGSDEFRGDLKKLQEKLLYFASLLHWMAYGVGHAEVLTQDRLNDGILRHLMADLPYGIDVASPQANLNGLEVAQIKTRRGKVCPALAEAALTTNAVGVALSGGGIRSATFCLGAIQVLAERRLFKDIDFLSTVSGGGYTGSFLSALLAGGPGNASFDDHYRAKIGGPYGPDPTDVRYVRQHAKYLMANGLAQQWLMVAGALAGLLMNWTVPVGLIALLALVGASIPSMAVPWATAFEGAGGVCALAFAYYAVSFRIASLQRPAGRALGLVVGLTAFLGVVCAIDTVYTSAWDAVSDWHLGPIFGLSAIAASGGPILVRFLPILSKPAVRTMVLKVLLVLAGIVLPIAAIVLFYVLRELGRAHPWVLLGIVVASVVVAIFLLNINKTAPFALYRGFLSKAFVEAGGAVPLLSTLGCQNGAPYHLVNAAVNLPASEKPTVRDRKTDFFLFSPKWCGSPSTNYVSTADWKSDGAELDLSTAMAVSGAAVSSHMGLLSMPTLTAMLTFLNVRLGFWLRKPPPSGGRPGFLCLLREMTGWQMSEREPWLNLSDGGHIENMGMYELLRRRCKFVICIDGEADPQSSFVGFMTLVRHAQIDFGIRIDPKLDDLRLVEATRCCKTHYAFCRIHYPPPTPIAPLPTAGAPTPAAGGPTPAAGAPTPAAGAPTPTPGAPPPTAGAPPLATPPPVGLLLYVKLSLTGNESELIKRYRLLHPDFPHQSTLDQFFDEEQFEAYRQLGVHAVDGLFSPALGTDAVGSIPAWFRQLAANLLEPLTEEAPFATSGRSSP